MTVGSSRITQAMRDAIGVTSGPCTHEVEKGDVICYARATGETDPLFLDEVAARRTRYGGIVAPPTYLIVMRPMLAGRLKLASPYPKSLDGGTRWRYLEPIRPGDRITATARLAELYERDGRLGTMLFQVIEIEYSNQHGQRVVAQRDTHIRYGTQEAGG